MEVLRFDFNGSSNDFKRTPQGFLRVNARLTKTGIFSYQNGREYRSEEEVFRTDSLDSLKGAPVTDLHPSERGADSFLTPANAKQHIIGFTECVEKEGHYLKGSLIIFHEDAIKAIENGERKEISLGYKCRLEPTPGSLNGDSYDAIQRDIIINHVAIGPAGWGRAGADCAIRTDSQKIISKEKSYMSETIRLDGVDVAFTTDAIATLFAEKNRQLAESRGRFDALGLELEKEKSERAALESPDAVESRVRSRLKIVEICKRILGADIDLEGKSDLEMKLLAIKKVYPDLKLDEKEPSYIDGMFEAVAHIEHQRNDSLANTRVALHAQPPSSANHAYEKWLQYSASLWTTPLTGSNR